MTTTSREQYRFVITAVDCAGVPWDVAYTRDPIAGLDIADSYGKAHPGVITWLCDEFAIDVDCSGTIDDTDDPIIERWLHEQPDSTLIAIAAGKHDVNFYDGNGSDEFDREFVIEFLMANGKVASHERA